jgi:hypothetical protein
MLFFLNFLNSATTSVLFTIYLSDCPKDNIRDSLFIKKSWILYLVFLDELTLEAALVVLELELDGVKYELKGTVDRFKLEGIGERFKLDETVELKLDRVIIE